MDDDDRTADSVETVGNAAPGFELLDDQGRLVRLTDFRDDQWAVLYFPRSFG